MNHIHELIRARYSTVIFSSKKIEDKKLASLFEAARWAPSAFNEQPWRFIVGVNGNDENYQKIYDCLMEANQAWAKYAPVLVLTIASKNSSVTGKPNRFAQYDTGMAVGNMLAQATSLGLYVHQMGGFSVSNAMEFFEIGDEYDIMSVMAIGYKGDIELFPEYIQERELKERRRKSIDEILM
ncbi:MAG: nitroreductase family protein [Bacteroidales bacterium]|nr:nitroreductase family protein [Bacteroidales bacterium]